MRLSDDDWTAVDLAVATTSAAGAGALTAALLLGPSRVGIASIALAVVLGSAAGILMVTEGVVE